MKEAEASPDFSRQPNRDPKPGSHARRDDETMPLRVGGDLGGDVTNDFEIHPPLHLLLGERDRLGRRRDIGAACGRRDADRTGPHVQLGQAHHVVRQDWLHPDGEALEHLAHIERLREHSQQRLDPIQPVPAAALDVPDPPVLDRRAQQRGNRPQHFLVLVGERVRAVGTEPDAAAEGSPGAERLPEGRSYARLEDLGVPGKSRIELGLGIVDSGDGPGPGTKTR